MVLPKVLPDTNVCYPISLLDLILRVDEANIHRVHWSEDLLEELARVWVRNGARTLEAAQRICQQVRDTFPDQQIHQVDYVDLIPTMPGPDHDDRVHAAAAVSVAPCTIITANLRDFPAAALKHFGVIVVTPDQNITVLACTHRHDLIEIINDMAAARTRTAMSREQLLNRLARSGLVNFANG